MPSNGSRRVHSSHRTTPKLYTSCRGKHKQLYGSVYGNTAANTTAADSCTSQIQLAAVAQHAIHPQLFTPSSRAQLEWADLPHGWATGSTADRPLTTASVTVPGVLMISGAIQGSVPRSVATPAAANQRQQSWHAVLLPVCGMTALSPAHKVPCWL